MYYRPFSTLFPCRHHRFCHGYIDPAQPECGSLCPDCLSKTDEADEQGRAPDGNKRVECAESAANDAIDAPVRCESVRRLPVKAQALYRYPIRLHFEHAGVRLVCPSFPEVVAVDECMGQTIAQALDSLKATLTLLVKQGRKIPYASASEDPALVLSLPMLNVLQIMLWNAMHEEGVSRVELARLMGCTHEASKRLVNFGRPPKIDIVERALRLLGRQLIVGVEGSLMCIIAPTRPMWAER